MAELLKSSFPPKATIMEKNLEDQSGKVSIPFILFSRLATYSSQVFIVTGSTAGIGEQLAAILYQHNAKVYVAARSEEKATKAIKEIKDLHPNSTGQIAFLHLDLSDLTTIKKSAEEFLSKEDRLDVLWNNAGVMIPPQGSKTVQGYELQLGTNNIGHFLFTKLLRPILVKTASAAPPNSVRVIWVASMAAQLAPKPAIDFENMDYKKDKIAWNKYCRSKAGSVVHAAEFARLTKAEGIVSMVRYFRIVLIIPKLISTLRASTLEI